MSVKTYKDLKEASLLDKLPYHIGILVAIPKSKKYKDNRIESETNAPTELDATPAKEWYLETVKPAKKKHRQRSMTELLFCMVRSSSRMLSNFKGE